MTYRPDHLELKLLGDGEFLLNGVSLKGRLQRKVLALLAFLATEQRPHHRDSLIELFWSGLDPDAARSNLRGALHRLGRVLGTEAFLEISRSTVTLKGCRRDIDRFMAPLPDELGSKELEAVIALYRGAFLEGMALDGCFEFEEWLAIKRETFQRRALALTMRLCDRYEAAGELAKAIRLVRRHLEMEPLDERFHRRLISLLAMAGSRHEAVEQFESCCRILKRELGYEPEPQTRALLDAILSGGIAARAEPARGDQGPTLAVPPVPAVTWERRQITALYCRLDTRDPEGRLEHFVETRRRYVELLQHLGGHCSEPHGRAILAYFGYPTACEHAALKAVQAALSLSGLGDPQTRICAGVHTGLTVASNQLVDEMGIISTLAQDLSDQNHPVTISESTFRLVEGCFHVEPARIQRRGDAGGAVMAYQVTGVSATRTRLDGAEPRPPMVGREAEFARLSAAWESTATRTSPQFLLVTGEPGIGKSRLIHALIEWMSTRGGAVRVARGLPEYDQSPYHVFVRLLEQACAFATADSPEEKARKLGSYVRSSSQGDKGKLPGLLAELLGLPATAAPEPANPRQKRQFQELLLHALRPDDSDSPSLLAIEDLHWADPSTLEVLAKFVEADRKTAQLVLFTARPHFVPPWASGKVAKLHLHPLDRAAIRSIAAAANPDMDGATIDDIVGRADGIPLFAEEMAKIAAQGTRQIPITLNDLLAARLDQVGAARQTALLAATIGREFALDLLTRTSTSSAEAVVQDLAALRGNGLIRRLSVTHYQFKHALIKEAVYQSQPSGVREAAHRRIAQALATHFPQVVSAQPELLAHHLTEAGETAPAIDAWVQAGSLAARRSANTEAKRHFNNALGLLQRLPHHRQRDATEFVVLSQLCPVLYAATGYGSDEATAANARLVELGDIDPDLKRFLPTWALVLNRICNPGSNKQDALGTALQLPALTLDEPANLVAMEYAIGLANFWLGRFEATRRHSEAARGHYRSDLHIRLVEQFGDDLYVNATAFAACACYFLGDPRRALELCAEMIAHARALPYPHTLAVALSWAAMVYRWLDLPEPTLALSAEIIELSDKHDFAVWRTVGDSTLGWAEVMLGDKTGLARLRASIENMENAVAGVPVLFKSPLAGAYLHTGHIAESLALLEEAAADANATGERFFDAEIQRLKGECLMAMSQPAQARACFLAALETSLDRQAHSLALRAAISLAQHLGEQEPLARLYPHFDATVQTPDLQRAGALMLGSGSVVAI